MFRSAKNSGHTARLWDVALKKQQRIFKGHQGDIRSVAFSPNSKTVLTRSDDGTARVWDISTGKELSILKHSDYITSVAYSPDGKNVLTGSYDEKACLWDVDSGKLLCTLKKGNKMIMKVVYSPNGKTVLTLSNDGVVLLWRLNLPQDVESWIVQKVAPLEAWLIVKASQEKRAYGNCTLLESSFEHTIVSNMPPCAQKYITTWYFQ